MGYINLWTLISLFTPKIIHTTGAVSVGSGLFKSDRLFPVVQRLECEGTESKVTDCSVTLVSANDQRCTDAEVACQGECCGHCVFRYYSIHV